MDFQAVFICTGHVVGLFYSGICQTINTEALSNTNGIKKTEEVRQKYIEKLDAPGKTKRKAPASRKENRYSECRTCLA